MFILEYVGQKIERPDNNNNPKHPATGRDTACKNRIKE